MFVSILFLAILFFLGYFYSTNSYDYWKRKKVPFVKPSFFLGNMKDVVLGKMAIGQFIEDMYNKSEEKYVGIWIFRTPNLIIRSPELIKHILIKDFDYFADRIILSDEKVDPIISQILFVVKNPKWKRIRQNMSTCFSSSKIKSMCVLIDNVGKCMRKNLSEKEESFVVDCKDFCRKFAVDTIVTCGFGLDAKSFEKENSPFLVASMKIFQLSFISYLRTVTNFLVPSIAQLFRISFLDPAAINFLKHSFVQTIQERENSHVFRNDVIDTLIQLRKSDKGKLLQGNLLAAQSVQIFIAGYETTSSTIAFTLHELCQNNDIQTKLREEITQTLEKHKSFTYEALKSMQYMDKVVSETLRKYPILPFLDRRCLKDYKIPDSDVIIEKGTAVLISILGLHYNPLYYPNPQVFDPERFSEEKSAKRSSYVYLPFGIGPRHCIGKSLGLLATKMALAHILLEFHVEKCEKTPEILEYNPSVNVLCPQKGLPMRVSRLRNYLQRTECSP